LKHHLADYSAQLGKPLMQEQKMQNIQESTRARQQVARNLLKSFIKVKDFSPINKAN